VPHPKYTYRCDLSCGQSATLSSPWKADAYWVAGEDGLVFGGAVKLQLAGGVRLGGGWGESPHSPSHITRI